MYEFDVKYTLENYLEYYKYVLFKSKWWRDVIFMVLFIGIAVYWWVDQSEGTKSNFVPIFACIMACIFPLMNLLTQPMLKKNLKARQPEIDRTHVYITFEADQVVYKNLSEDPSLDEKKEEPKEEKLEEQPVEEEKTEENKTEDETGAVDNRTFILKYENFSTVRELDSLYLFYLDKQTLIILPKTTLVKGEHDKFKEFIVDKIPDKRRIKFAK